ncbi:hypothetical protein D3C84_836280 [compost metagenome]
MTALTWSKTRPIPADLNGHPEEYFWARGGYFNRPIMVRANNGVNSDVIGGQRVYRAEVNFNFFSDGFPDHIWSSDLSDYPWLLELEWAGPIERVPDHQPAEQ